MIRSSKSKIRKRKDNPEPERTGLSFTLIISAMLVFILHHLPGVEGAKPPDSVLFPPPVTFHKIPEFEIYPKEEIKPSRGVPHQEILLPKVAIIIDDIGYDSAIAEKFLNLDSGITLSILPNASAREKIAARAVEKGVEIMLHLPMEPMEYPAANPGPGALFSSMSPKQLLAQLDHNLDMVPFIRGVNNHMGSKLTARSTQMYQLMSVLKKRGLFFVDSYTTGDSRCLSAARMQQIPFAQRDIFLDHVQEPEIIRGQIRKLIRTAKEHGEAIGIGHPHAVTYSVLKEELPRLKKETTLVPASKLVHIIG